MLRTLPVAVLGLLAVHFFSGATSGTQAKEKKAPQVPDEIVEQLASEWILKFLVRDMRATAYELAASKVDESFEYRLAWLTSLKGPFFVETTPALLESTLTLERRFNDTMKVEHAEALVKAKVLANKVLTKDYQSSKDKVEINLNKNASKDRLDCMVKSQAILDKGRSKKLSNSREKVKALIREAIANNPEALPSFSRAREIAKKVATDELRQSRKEFKERIEKSSPK